MKLDGAVAVIAGGASGLGEETARYLSQCGMKVGVVDIQSCGTTPSVKVDITDEAQIIAAFRELANQLGTPRLVLNTTGVGGSGLTVGPSASVDAATFRRVLEVNTLGAFNLVRAAAMLMINSAADDQGERGVIINTSSIVAMEGQIGTAAYAAAKGGVNAMTLPLARELARYGVRVMTVAPGIFETPMFSNARGPMVDWLRDQVVYPDRPGNAVEFAEMIEHIGCNRMLNGSVIRLDGAYRVPPGKHEWWEN